MFYLCFLKLCLLIKYIKYKKLVLIAYYLVLVHVMHNIQAFCLHIFASNSLQKFHGDGLFIASQFLKISKILD